MSNPGLGHDWNGDSIHDLLDQSRVRHAGNTSLGSDIGGDSLEGHDGHSTGFFCYASLHCELLLAFKNP